MNEPSQYYVGHPSSVYPKLPTHRMMSKEVIILSLCVLDRFAMQQWKNVTEPLPKLGE